MSISEPMRRAVVLRAANRCEYCGLSQTGQEARFHLDHIVPEMAGGLTALENLALACVSCSLRKGARQSALDPASGKPAPLFHPRTQKWRDHFAWRGCRLAGKTPTGRATIDALKLNRLLALSIRSEELQRGRHPPPA